MIPLYDTISARRLCVTNYGIIAACVAVFLVQTFAADRGLKLVEDFGLIPRRITAGNQSYIATLASAKAPSGTTNSTKPSSDAALQAPIILTIEPTPIPPLATLVTCLFLHAGWLQLLINLWFLAIFGDNVEDRFGHLGYLGFYLLCGLFSGLLVLFLSGGSVLVTIGASGAVGGVLGAYLVIFPNSRIVTLTPFGKMFRRIHIPAQYLFVVWVILQFALASITHPPLIALTWWGHFGGVAGGLLLALILRAFGWLQPGELEDPHAERGYF